jgi:alpha-L-rhamnosidase
MRRDDLAFLVTNKKTYPGWGYMVEQGATTMWERWDGKWSQIHSTLLAAGEWFPRALAGIKPDESQPGFKRVIIDPRPVGDLTWAKARYDTIRGPVVSDWKLKDNRFFLNVEVPANTTALVHIPAQYPEAVTENGRPAGTSPGVTPRKTDPGFATFEVGSGRYHFASERSR